MTTHVNGENAPLTIGELRHSILAVLVGNSLFTEQEQLLGNHQAHECEDAAGLATQLQELRLQDAWRAGRRRQSQSVCMAYPAVCQDKEKHLVELAGLLRSVALNKSDRRLLSSMMLTASFSIGDRLRHLGNGWQQMFENLGYDMAAPRGFSAIRNN